MAAFSRADHLLSHEPDSATHHAPPSPAKVALFGAVVFAIVFVAAMGGTAFMITGGAGGGEPRSHAPSIAAPRVFETSVAEESVFESAPRVSGAPTSVVFVPRDRVAAPVAEVGEPAESEVFESDAAPSDAVLAGAPPPAMLPAFPEQDEAF